MKILVTGNNGSIGKAFVNRAENEGHKIIGYDIPHYDILDEHSLCIKIQESDMVVHFAAVADLNDSMADQDSTFHVNIKGTYNVGKYCSAFEKPLIFISTCCVYGNTEDDVEIERYTVPQTCEPYATSKMAGEYILKGIPDLNYCILRIGTTYGVGMRKELFTFIVLDKVWKSEQIEIHGDGEQTRNLIYIDDLIEGIYSAMMQWTSVSGETINICGDEQISVLDCIDAAEHIVGKEAIFTHIPDRYGQIKDENISIQRADMLLDWQPKHKFFESMRYVFHHDERFKK